MAQSDQFHETFAYLRDNARAVRPDDVYALREAREFQAPSRAHIKRIERVRPMVLVATPKPVSDVTRRIELNQAVAIARAYGLVPAPYVARPLPPKPVNRTTPDKARLAPDHAELRAASMRAEAARIASFGDRELGRAWAIWSKI